MFSTLALGLSGAATGVVLIGVGTVLGVWVALPKTPNYWLEASNIGQNARYGRRIS